MYLEWVRTMKNKLLILLTSIFLLSGCWNYNELNELAICTGMAIDYEDEKYTVTYMIAKTNSSDQTDSSSKASTTTYEGSGKNIAEAIQEINRMSPKKTYIGHLNIIVISESVAKNGLKNMLDYLLREPESRKKFYFILAKDVKASETLKILSPLESFTSQNIATNIESVDQLQAIANDITYSKFVSNILKEGLEPMLNSITIKGDEEKGQEQDSIENSQPEAFIRVGSLGIFKDDKLLGWISDDESRGINIITNNVGTMNITTKCGDNYMTATTDDLKTDVNIDVQGDQVKIKLDVKAEAAIAEINCKVNIEDPKEINELEKKFGEKVEEYIKKALDITQKEYKSDVLGFGNMLYRNNYKTWKKIKDKWNDELFPNAEVEINVSIDLKKKGSLEQTIEVMKDEK